MINDQAIRQLFDPNVQQNYKQMLLNEICDVETEIQINDISLVGGKIENLDLSKFNFIGTDLSQVSIANSRLGSMHSCLLTNSRMTATCIKELKYCTMHEAVLSSCRVMRNVNYTDFSNTLLWGCRFSASAAVITADISRNKFTRAKLAHVDFAGSDLSGCYFDDSIICKSRMSRTKMDDVSVANTKMDHVNLCESTLLLNQLCKSNLSHCCCTPSLSYESQETGLGYAKYRKVADEAAIVLKELRPLHSAKLTMHYAAKYAYGYEMLEIGAIDCNKLHINLYSHLTGEHIRMYTTAFDGIERSLIELFADICGHVHIPEWDRCSQIGDAKNAEEDQKYMMILNCFARLHRKNCVKD